MQAQAGFQPDMNLLHLPDDFLRAIVKLATAGKDNAVFTPFRSCCCKLRDIADSCVTEIALSVDPSELSWQLPALQRYKSAERLQIDLRRACLSCSDMYSLLMATMEGCNMLHTLHVLCGAPDGVDTFQDDSQCAEQFSYCLGNLKMLKMLRFSGNGVHVSGPHVLGAALRHSASLQTLAVDVAISDYGVAVIAPALQVNNALASLKLSQAAVSDTGAAALALGLASNAGLTTLDLSKNSIGEAGMLKLAQAIAVNHSLVSLDLSFNSAQNTGTALLGEMLMYNSTLQDLGLRFNGIGPTGTVGLACGLKHNSSLQRLDLSLNPLQDIGAEYLGSALQVNRGLVRLMLDQADISDEGTIQLAAGLASNGTLQELLLSHNRIGPSGATALATAMASSYLLGYSGIKHSDSSSDTDSCMDSDDDSDDAALYNAFNRMTVDSEQRSVFSTPPGLRKLDLNFNSIGDAGVCAVGSCLSEVHGNAACLQELLVQDNSISGSGCEVLAGFVGLSETLQVLDMSRNLIGDVGACSLGLALQMNMSMLRVSVQSCCIKEAGALGLAVGLKASPTLESVHAQGNSFQFVRLKLRSVLQFCIRKSFLF